MIRIWYNEAIMYTPEHWKLRALSSLYAAKILYREQCFRDVASRSYYSAYQAATAICVEHGDAVNFPAEWNNPSHDQLPDLILNNGDIARTDRRTLYKLLQDLRKNREDADYRVGITIDCENAYFCLRSALTVLRILQIEETS